MSTTVKYLDSDTRRHVTLETADNFRDLGGYRTLDGRTTRWGLLFRADGLGQLGTGDFDVIRKLGLRTVIDLRSHAELIERGRFPHEDLDLDYEHHPILDVLWADHDTTYFGDDREFLVWAYREMLAIGGGRFASAINRLARSGALPAVFHCTAGKDRTGLLAALLLSALGVRRHDVLADYQLSEAAMERMVEWARRAAPETAERLAGVPAFYFAALPEALDHVLDDLKGAHGSIREYVLSLGVDTEALDTIATILLEPAP